MKKVTPIKAIRIHCLSCSGGSYRGVKDCNIPECSLYPYRFGKRPKVNDMEVKDKRK